MTMRVLITGAGGFIGRHLVADQLRRGRTVTAVDLHPEALQPLAANERLHVITGDFRDQDLLDPLLPGHNRCFHLASAHLETGLSKNYFWQVNVSGTRDFVARCRQAGIPRFIHCSSVGVFGNVRQPPADESSPCHPDIPYEQSKLAGEEAVLAYAADHNYDLVVIRPAWVYGPGCPRTARLFRTIQKGRFFFVGDGQRLRHPIYISDMIAGFEQAAAAPHASGRVYIMAGPRAVTLRELAGAIATTLGAAPPRLRLPYALVWPGCLLLETAGALLRRDVPFTRRSLKFFTGNSAFSSERACRELSFNPTVDLAEGLARTAAWIRGTAPEIG